jgi:hypothetical protein
MLTTPFDHWPVPIGEGVGRSPHRGQQVASFAHASARHVSDIQPLAADLRNASGTGRNGEPEAMQFRDGGDQAEAKTQPWVATAFIGTRSVS